MVQLTKDKMGWGKLPGMILVGHSLGGAVVVDAAKQAKLGNAVLGYAVLDVVEGGLISTSSTHEDQFFSPNPVRKTRILSAALSALNLLNQVPQSMPYKACKPTSHPGQSHFHP